MTDTTQQQTPSNDERKLPSALDYARRHPALAVIGAAAVGLLGGVEMAAGVIIGAGVAAFARGRNRPVLETEATQPATQTATQAATQATTQATTQAKERGRQFMSHLPEVKERARAVMQAMRGQLHSTDHHSTS